MSGMKNAGSHLHIYGGWKYECCRHEMLSKNGTTTKTMDNIIRYGSAIVKPT